MSKILIVDDDAQLRQSFNKLLCREGYDVAMAATGEAAVSMVRESSPDLVILDVRLPGMDGLETLEQLLQIDSRLPVIIMTAYTTTDTAIKATQRGAFDYVIKPFDIPDILKLINEALEVNKAMRAQGESESQFEPGSMEGLIGVDKWNGLFELKGPTLNQVLESEDIVAMEMVDTAFSKPQLYVDAKLDWTEVLGSDAHHPSGEPGQRFPGSRFTWVKMGSPSIEGLRLALLDGLLSVRRSDDQGGEPNEHAALMIESVEVSDARYMGRGTPFRIALNPWLNTVIGGRGTGKSTLVEFLRLILRREGELPKTLKEDFSKYYKVRSGREDDGLLTEDSSFKIIYRKNGAHYRLGWSPRGDAEPIEVEDRDGTWKSEQGDVAQRFPVRIFSQKQIFELAKDPLALLYVVDAAEKVDKRSWKTNGERKRRNSFLFGRGPERSKRDWPTSPDCAASWRMWDESSLCSNKPVMPMS